MKNKFYWIDLAVCSVWILAILGDRHIWNSALELITILTVVMRVTYTFVSREMKNGHGFRYSE